MGENVCLFTLLGHLHGHLHGQKMVFKNRFMGM